MPQKLIHNADQSLSPPLLIKPVNITLHTGPKLCGTGKMLSSFSPPLIQAKLKIGAPNDKYEQEADRVADQVMRMPEPGTVQTQQSPPQIQRLCPECEDELHRQPEEEEEEEELVNAKVESGRCHNLIQVLLLKSRG